MFNRLCRKLSAGTMIREVLMLITNAVACSGEFAERIGFETQEDFFAVHRTVQQSLKHNEQKEFGKHTSARTSVSPCRFILPK